MKVLFYCILLIGCIGIVFAETYTNKFDNVDIDQILKNDRLLKNYVNCVLDKGKCSPDGAELKKTIPDALKTGCTKCTERQKQGAKKVLNYMIEHKRDWWNEIEAKYDPEGVYRKKYEEEAKKEGIQL